MPANCHADVGSAVTLLTAFACLTRRRAGCPPFRSDDHAHRFGVPGFPVADFRRRRLHSQMIRKMLRRLIFKMTTNCNGCDPAHTPVGGQSRYWSGSPGRGRSVRYGERHESKPMEQERAAGRDRPAGARRPPSAPSDRKTARAAVTSSWLKRVLCLCGSSASFVFIALARTAGACQAAEPEGR
jgi:hypothetical protein